MKTIVDMLDEAARAAPDRDALVQGDTALSYAEFARASGAFGRYLANSGYDLSCVLIAYPNSIEFNVMALAVMAAGGEVCPVNPGYSTEELSALIAQAEPSLCLVSVEVATKLSTKQDKRTFLAVSREFVLEKKQIGSEDPVFPEANQPALRLFTGGTTGVSKTVRRSHEALVETMRGMHISWPAEPDQDVWLNIAPSSHIWGFLMGLCMPIHYRARLIIFPAFNPSAVVEALARQKVTVFGGGPAPIYSGLLSAPNFDEADLSSLRLCPCGGAPCPPELMRAWERRTGRPLLQAYGMTEAAPITASPIGATGKIGSVGKPMPGLDLQIVDILNPGRQLAAGEAGEICIRGSTVFREYENAPEETAEAFHKGWFRTGDIGHLDEDGFVFLVDRKKDMLIVGGFNVFPSEIEKMLLSYPGVAEAACVGAADARKGEVPICYVVVKDGQTIEPEELVNHCATKLIAYKRPLAIHRVDALPRTAANKIDKKALRAMAA
jgi:long-chain acyl-CoA synthetase